MPDNELQMFVASCVAHYDEMTGIRSLATKNEVFHLISGIWMTPAERCFMWLGGFRPSDLIKVYSVASIQTLTLSGSIPIASWVLSINQDIFNNEFSCFSIVFN